MKITKFIITLIISIIIVIWLISNNHEEKIYYKKPFILSDISLIPIEQIESLDSLDLISLNKGKEEMAKHKIVIAGITRDNIRDIPTTIRHINYIGSFFKDYRVILFENDSTDGTKSALEKWQASDSKVRIITKDFFNKKRPSHKFMAEARNYYLEALKSNEYNDFDLLLVLDMDMKYGIDVRAIEDSFSKINEWDAVCSNGIGNSEGKMFDSFAFRNDEFPFSPQEWQENCSKNDPNNKWTKTCDKGKEYSKGIILDSLSFITGWQKETRLYWLLIMPQIQKIYNIDAELVPVTSCFGGLAIYKRSIINDCEYDSIENDSEHIAFHQCINNKHNARMFLNPAQIIRYSHYK